MNRANIAHIKADKSLDLNWAADASGGYPPAGVCALAISGSILYVGGNFTTIGGQPRNYIAALDAATGNVTGWNPGGGGR